MIKPHLYFSLKESLFTITRSFRCHSPDAAIRYVLQIYISLLRPMHGSARI